MWRELTNRAQRVSPRSSLSGHHVDDPWDRMQTHRSTFLLILGPLLLLNSAVSILTVRSEVWTRPCLSSPSDPSWGRLTLQVLLLWPKQRGRETMSWPKYPRRSHWFKYTRSGVRCVWCHKCQPSLTGHAGSSDGEESQFKPSSCLIGACGKDELICILEHITISRCYSLNTSKYPSKGASFHCSCSLPERSNEGRHWGKGTEDSFQSLQQTHLLAFHIIHYENKDIQNTI